MATPREDTEAAVDARRGIQNTEVRFARTQDTRSMQAQLLNTMNDARTEADKEQQADLWETQMRAEERLQFESEAQEQEIQENTMREFQMKQMRANMAAKKGAGGTKKFTGVTRIFGLTTLAWAALLQTIFAILSASWFGLEMAKEAACDIAIVSWICSLGSALAGVAESFTGMSVSFVGIAWIWWIFATTIALLTAGGFAILFRLQGILFWEGTGNRLFFICALILNLVPFLNFLPLIQGWALYWMIRGVVETVPGLSKTSKQSTWYA